MKTCTATPTTWELMCPECRDVILAPGGSEYWTAEDFIGKKTVECFECKAEAKIPAKLIKENG